MQEPLIKTGIYKHYKKGDLYFVTGIVIDAETDQVMVLYYSLYKESPPFFRRFSNFDELVRVRVNDEGKDVKRFELIKEISSEKAKFFIPGSIVFIQSGEGGFMRIKINRVFVEEEKVMISYSYIALMDQEVKVTLEDFLIKYEP